MTPELAEMNVLIVELRELVDRLAPVGASRHEWLAASEVADRFGISRAWIYEHAEELGAVRLGSGKRPRLRFDQQTVEAYFDSDRQGAKTTPERLPVRSRSRTRRSSSAPKPLLPIRRSR